MNLFRKNTGDAKERPSVLIELRLVDKFGLPIDPSYAWLALLEAFQNHKHLEVQQARVSPDKEGPIHE
jgi:hypothetical protein